MKKAIFDVDGTLVNTREGIVHTIQDVLGELGLSYNGDLDLWIGPPIKKSFMDFCGLIEEDAQKATRLYRKRYIKKYITESTLYPGMRETLDMLRRNGVRLAIATMKTGPQVDRLFSYFGIKDYFEEIKTAREDGSLSKAQMIAELMDSDETYMIGDTISDQIATQEAECSFIGVTYGFGFKPGERYSFITVKEPKELIREICFQ